MKLGPKTQVRQVAQCAYQNILKETVVILPRTRWVHLFNEVGSEIWKFLEEPRRVEEVVSHLCEEFEVDEETARRDALEFLNILHERELIELVP